MQNSQWGDWSWSWTRPALFSRGHNPKWVENWGQRSLGSTAGRRGNKSFITEGGLVWHTMLPSCTFTLHDDLNTLNSSIYVYNDLHPFLLLIFCWLISSEVPDSPESWFTVCSELSYASSLKRCLSSSSSKKCWIRSCPKYLSNANTHA